MNKGANKRNASYHHRVHPGDIVTLAYDVQGVIRDRSNPKVVGEIIDRPWAPKGAKVLVTAEYNAGFRGIEFSFEYNGQQHWTGISTQAIEERHMHDTCGYRG